MTSDSYVKATIKTVESRLTEEYKQLMRITKSLLTSGYQNDIDVLEILGPDADNWFQHLIGILNWIVELGHININT